MNVGSIVAYALITATALAWLTFGVLAVKDWRRPRVRAYRGADESWGDELEELRGEVLAEDARGLAPAALVFAPDAPDRIQAEADADDARWRAEFDLLALRLADHVEHFHEMWEVGPIGRALASKPYEGWEAAAYGEINNFDDIFAKVLMPCAPQ